MHGFDAPQVVVTNGSNGTLNAGAVFTLVDASGLVVATAAASPAAVAIEAGQTGTLAGVFATPAALSASAALNVLVSLSSQVFLSGSTRNSRSLRCSPERSSLGR